MTLETKQRIVQIRRSEVPEGYKKTKVGIVPKEWEEHNLSYYLTVNNDKNTDLKYSKDDVFSISGELGIVNQIELLGRSYAGASVAPYGIVYPDDVVYTKSPLKANPYGIIKTNKLGVTGIVSTLYAIFHCKQNVNPSFVQLYFESDHNLNNYLYPIVNIGAKHDMKISDEGSLRGIVVFPPLSEQEKIVEIMDTQDRIIELCEKKVDQLKKLKKVFLQKMFPKNGEVVPEWRFPQFTDDWEQRKLSDDFSDFIVPMRDKPKEFGGSIPWTRIEDIEGKYLNGTLSGHYVSEETVKYMNLKKIPKNSLIVSSSATFGIVAIVTQDLITNQTFIGLVPNEQATLDYWYSFFQSEYARKYMKLQSAGSTIFYISRESFENMPTVIPNNEEMVKIGSFFSKLDTLLTLHQRKCDEEKRKKKALTQLLLKGIVRVKI